jgi:hypothetical protein
MSIFSWLLALLLTGCASTTATPLPSEPEATVMASPSVISAQAGWVAPTSQTQCPSNARIKGNLTTHNGEYCIYHVPGGASYSRTHPEKCFSTEADARAAGCRRSQR